MDRCDQAIQHAVIDTLENMAFVEVTPMEPNSTETVSDQDMTVSLLIHNPIQGELRIKMPHTVVAQITETVYGMPAEELSEQILHDNLGEVINIIAGRFMTELLSEGEMFQLGLPELNPIDIADASIPSRTWRYQIDTAEFSVTVIGNKLLKIT
ncbi:MAG: chemotaxis protein CheX [Desulfuromonadaceae bacterium]|jgi:CheY-specific phosphatase CheX